MLALVNPLAGKSKRLQRYKKNANNLKIYVFIFRKDKSNAFPPLHIPN